jgi:hypothetical protein
VIDIQTNERRKKMETIYCPVCSKKISDEAVITACPDCCHPFNAHEWKEARAKKIATVYGELEEKLKTRRKVQLIDAYNKQKSTTGWTFYNENDIVQRTLENRFNFLLVVYTLFLGAYFQSECDIDKLFILIIGFLLIWFLRLGIRRTTNRFNITLDIVHSLEDDDVSPIIHKENGCRHPNEKKYRNNSIMGIIIPNIMFYSIVIGIIIHIGKFILQIPIVIDIITHIVKFFCNYWN